MFHFHIGHNCAFIFKLKIETVDNRRESQGETVQIISL